MRLHLSTLLTLVLVGCLPPVNPTPPFGDSGIGDAGGVDAGGVDAGGLDASAGEDAGAQGDGGHRASRLDAFAWIPLDGTQCASGARAGIGLDEGPADAGELFVYLMGGGACWNQGTCTPSLLRFGPICSYGGFPCLYTGAGGQAPTAVYVTDADPFPADGGGAFRSELSALTSSAALDRSRPGNPFKDATFVFVPYCTGDLHAGAATRTYPTQYDPFQPAGTTTIHHAGAANMTAVLAYLAKRYPAVKTVWLTGASGGGYGATLNFQRTWEAFPQAEVSLLADSAPLVQSRHWDEWKAAWSFQFPSACGAACDAGLPQVYEAVTQAAGARRLALLSNDADQIITWFFYSPDGLEGVLTPPTATFTANLSGLVDQMDTSPNARAFVVPGTSHVLFGSYGLVLPDGGVSAALPSRDGGTTLRAWVDAWAAGAPGWTTTR